MSEHGQGVEEGRRKAARKCWKATKTAVIKDTWVPLLTLPWKCALNCLCCSCRQAGIEASCWVWQCVQCWTPLSLTVLLLWLLYRPDRFHPTVDSASLASLDLNGNSLRYNLAVDLSFRNSNRLLSISYLDVGASASYNGTSLGLAGNSLPGSFRQGANNTTVLHAVFQGMVMVADVQVQEGLAKELERERGSGAVRVRVHVDLTIMYKVIVKEIFFYSYECYLPFTPLPNAVFLSDSAPCFRV
ncbi:hypothetical protein CFC21_055880 [Triticum aestivum]|uniref:Late embryogenesis abundant protein LEA-2 subgroup domain-containing protein n=2 Tax=Triticum aestivum TaxID=4565 RepID=A0A3B6I3P1_WHEAT|nr:hypothetical protein CFC21_055880 [Triticum aestivum]